MNYRGNMKNIALRSLALLAFVALLAFGVNAFTHEPTTTPVHDSPTDVEFLDMMTMHHQQGVEMARMAETKGQLPRLKEFAQRTIADQQQDIQKMQDTRSRFYADVSKADKMRMPGKPMTMAMMERMSQTDMQKLEAASGAEFDRLFLTTFIKHHQMAIDMSRHELKGGQQQEVKDMARETIAKQTKDIGEMREMLRQVGGAPATSRRSARRRA